MKENELIEPKELATKLGLKQASDIYKLADLSNQNLQYKRTHKKNEYDLLTFGIAARHFGLDLDLTIKVLELYSLQRSTNV